MARYDDCWSDICSSIKIESFTRWDERYNPYPYSISNIYNPVIESAKGTLYEIDIPEGYWINTSTYSDVYGRHVEIFDEETNSFIYIYENGHRI